MGLAKRMLGLRHNASLLMAASSTRTVWQLTDATAEELPATGGGYARKQQRARQARTRRATWIRIEHSARVIADDYNPGLLGTFLCAGRPCTPNLCY